MFYDALTLRAYVAEVVQRFPTPWFVQKFSQVGEHDFLLNCRLGPGKSFRWLLSLQPQQPTLRWWRAPKPQALAPSSFTMLVRKYLQGRSIERVEVLYPERLLRLQGREHTVMVELLERQPNALLLSAAGLILGGFRLGRNNERELRARRPYTAPPQPGLPDAQSLSRYQLEEIYFGNPAEWPRSVLQRTFGLSPAACQQLGRLFQELRAASTGSIEDDLWAAWQSLWRCASQGYHAVKSGDKLSIWGEGPPRLLLELEEEASAPALPGLETQRLRASQQLIKVQRKLQQRLAKLAGDRDRVGQADILQREGELLLTYQHQVPKGASQTELLDWDGQTPVKLSLDPALPLVLQAQKRLKRAAKFRRSLPVVEARVLETQAEIRRLEASLFEVQQMESLADLHELMSDLAPKGRPVAGPGAAGALRRAGPRRYRFGEFHLLVGRSPRQNDDLVRRYSARDDLWFHVKDSPGAHVLLKTAGASPEEAVVEAAAVLAAHYSSRAKENKVLVSFTAAQRVKKPSGAAPGLVVYSDELTLWVDPTSMPARLQRQA